MLFAVVLPLNAQISGYIIDDATGDSIPYASVIYRGHNVAVASNLSGYYTIERHDGWQLTFSSVGYEPQTVTIGPKTKGRLDIKLKPDTRKLKEVTVRAKRGKYSRKNNPAVELMKKVIAAKKRTDLDNRDFYQYNKYQKITLAINDITPEKLQTPKLKKMPWLRDQVEKCQYNGKLILPLSVDETVTQKIYRKDPHSEKNIVKGQSSTGINDLFQTGDILTTTLKDVFTDVNIYDDQVRLLQYPFTSPIGKNAIAFYRFYIEDTVFVDREKCFHLHFLPNNQQDFGFRGDIYIMADSSYQVKRCELTIPKRSDVNFVENLRVLQEFKQLPDSTWVLTQDDMVAELKLTDFLAKAIVIRTTRLSDYAFDALPKQLFKGKAREVKEADAMMRDDDFWNKYRQVHLTQSESKMDAFVHNLEQIKGFKYIIFGAKALIENYVETGNPSKVDIGPINTMISSNFIDGVRTRLSAQTTAKLNPHLFLSGYYARGWDSHKNYYKGEVTYSFNKKEYLPREFPKRTLTFSSTYDVTSPSDKFMHTDKDNVFTALKWTKVDKMMFYNRQELTFEREEDWGFKTTVSMKTEENEACGHLHFRPMATGADTVYPAAHRPAARRIEEKPGSALVTDYPLHTQAIPVNFVRRNRIIAGMCRATILIESRLKGGGMITADQAFSYDRDVFVLPGRADDPMSAGCNYLIRTGCATPITSEKNLMESLGFSLKKAEGGKRKLSEYYRGVLDSCQTEQMSRILLAIKKNRRISMDELSETCSIGYNTVAGLCGILETDGFIDIDLMQRCTINRKK